MHLYVYYDVPLDAIGSAIEKVRAMQSELGQTSARVLKRPERRDGVETWMEVYEDVCADFESRLAASAVRHGLTMLTRPRQVERFEDMG